jgi:hypothetical protein
MKNATIHPVKFSCARKLVFLLVFVVSILSSINANAVNVVITGLTTVCPKNENPHKFTAKSYIPGTSTEVSCSHYWGVHKNGVLLAEGSGSTFFYTFEDIGNYQITAFTTSCPWPYSGGSTSITVNSRVKMPNPITGPVMCNTGQAYTFSSNPPLPSDDNDCNYHYANLWTAPSGWKINGGGYAF